MKGDTDRETVESGAPSEPLARGAAAVLVVGPADTDHDAACERLAAAAESGHRIRGATRSQLCARTDTFYADVGSGVFDDLSLPELGMTLSDAILTLDADPASGLHVCIDGLRLPDADSVSERRLFRFAHAMTNRVRSAGGVCHVHLRAPEDDARVATLEPLFDVVLELREGAEGLEARTHNWTDGTGQWLPTSAL